MTSIKKYVIFVIEIKKWGCKKMIVKEIIETLKQYPENINVKILAEYDGGCCTLCEDIEYIGKYDIENSIVLCSYEFQK